MYMIGGNEFVIFPNANGNFISFYGKDAVLGELQTFKSSALGNTSLVPFIANAQATFNNNAPISNVSPTLQITYQLNVMLMVCLFIQY